MSTTIGIDLLSLFLRSSNDGKEWGDWCGRAEAVDCSGGWCSVDDNGLLVDFGISAPQYRSQIKSAALSLVAFSRMCFSLCPLQLSSSGAPIYNCATLRDVRWRGMEDRLET